MCMSMCVHTWLQCRSRIGERRTQLAEVVCSESGMNSQILRPGWAVGRMVLVGSSDHP